MRYAIRSKMTVGLVLVLIGCASTATPTTREQTAMIPGTSSAMTITAGAAPFVKIVAAPLDEVWRSVPMAYDSLAIPISLIDPKMHVVGNEGFKIRQKLGSTRLSTYVECGTTQVGPNADSYEVFFTIMTQLEARGPTETKVTTTITAAAKPMAFAQDYSRCSTKDELEGRIIAVINGRLKR